MRATWLGLWLCLIAAAPVAADDPLTRPIATDPARGWVMPQPPAHVFGNTYLVGFAGLNVGLIHTRAGLILIDAGLPQGGGGRGEHPFTWLFAT